MFMTAISLFDTLNPQLAEDERQYLALLILKPEAADRQVDLAELLTAFETVKRPRITAALGTMARGLTPTPLSENARGLWRLAAEHLRAQQVAELGPLAVSVLDDAATLDPAWSGMRRRVEITSAQPTQTTAAGAPGSTTLPVGTTPPRPVTTRAAVSPPPKGKGRPATLKPAAPGEAPASQEPPAPGGATTSQEATAPGGAPAHG